MNLKLLNYVIFAMGFALQDKAWAANCVSSEFVQDYCYQGLAKQLDLNSVAVKPVQYGYLASTIIEIRRRETVKLVVICSNGQKPVNEFFRVVKDERKLLSEERYRVDDAVQDLTNHYDRIRTRLNQYLCTN